MSSYSLKVIPKPQEGTAAVLILSKKGKFSIIKGQGADNYLCGTCENIICENVDRGQIINLVFKCPDCSSYNVIKGI